MSTLSKKHKFHEVFDSQKVYRLILEAMSNPGRTVTIREYAEKMFGEKPAFLALAMTLLDNEVTFHTGEDGRLSEEIVSLTLAKKAELMDADFIFVSGSDDLKTVIENAKCGSLTDPHKSALILIENGDCGRWDLTLHGPGIDGECTILASGLVKRALQLRDEQCYEYPQGIDFIFVTDEGDLFGIPRLVSWEVN